MPWKERTIVDDRTKFIARLLGGERMTDLCREFGISRKTGHKFLKRYNEVGPIGLESLSKRPFSYGNSTKPEIEKLILDLKKERPTWGAPKLTSYLAKRHSLVRFPAISTVHAILERNDLVCKRLKKRYKATGTILAPTKAPNDLWCTDFKGQFKLKNGRYCYPLTLTDQHSRYLIACDSLENNRTAGCFPIFYRAFKEYGMPNGIRSDNGVPFASSGIFGLSKLSVWWLRLGIKLERIKPGHPEQNGRHERMHLTLKQSTTRPPGKNHLHQQELFDSFIEEFNTIRPHAALAMTTPKENYQPSLRVFPDKLEDPDYSFSDKTRIVSAGGSIRLNSHERIYIGTALEGQIVAITEIDEGLWKVNFMEYELGYFDDKCFKLKTGLSPFGSTKEN